MTILTLTNCPIDTRLGSGKTVVRFTEGLRRLGHDVDVLAPDDYEVWPRVGRGKQLRQGIGSFLAVRAALAGRSYDIVEFYGAEFWPAIAYLSRLRHRPLLVAHTNGLELLNFESERRYEPAQGLKSRVSRALHTPLLKRSFVMSDAFVSLAEPDRAYVVRNHLYPIAMTAVVPPGLDDEFRTLATSEGEPRQDRVTFMGSWIRRKGTSVIVPVMTQVLRDHPAVAFDIFGAHSDAADIHNAFDRDLLNRITVHGPLPTPELVARLRLGKVFFFPSEYEGYGLALLEGMACGLAAVATPTGLGAGLEDGIAAFVCGFGDADCMVAAIDRLLRDENGRGAIARRGQRLACSLTWEASVEQLATVYRGWLDGGQ